MHTHNMMHTKVSRVSTWCWIMVLLSTSQQSNSISVGVTKKRIPRDDSSTITGCGADTNRSQWLKLVKQQNNGMNSMTEFSAPSRPWNIVGSPLYPSNRLWHAMAPISVKMVSGDCRMKLGIYLCAVNMHISEPM